MNLSAVSFIVLVLLSFVPKEAQPGQVASQAPLRDIRGPLPSTGLPPFAGATLVLMVAGLSLVVIVKARKGRRAMVAPSTLQQPAADDLAALLDAYSRGEMPADTLFLHLAGVASSRLVQGDCRAMTSKEVLKSAVENVPAELIAVAEAFFATFDRVRFGGFRPDAPAVAEACAAVHLIVHRLPVKAP